ncbi:hypothetical protein U1Q18_026909 [Sarracenia purpurea var. burkii]
MLARGSADITWMSRSTVGKNPVACEGVPADWGHSKSTVMPTGVINRGKELLRNRNKLTRSPPHPPVHMIAMKRISRHRAGFQCKIQPTLDRALSNG